MPEIYSVLVTGSSRGIGLEFVKQFLTSSLVKTQIVIATCRTPEKATALQELKTTHKNLHILKLDVTEFNSFDQVVSEVRKIVGSKGLTLLINNAAIILRFSQKIDEVKPEEFISVFKTNSVAPVMLTKALRPLLKQSAQVNAAKHSGLGITRAAIINLTSVLGSSQLVGLNQFESYGCYGYRESKSSLNMSTQSLSLELRDEGILVECLEPGFVKTDMTAEAIVPAEITTETSVTGMLQVMLKMTGKNKNGFSTWRGETMPF